MLKEFKTPLNLIEECLNRKGESWEVIITAKESAYSKKDYTAWFYILTEETQVQEIWLMDELQLEIPSKCYHEFLNIEYTGDASTQYIVVLCFSVQYEYKCVVMGVDISIGDINFDPYELYEEFMKVAKGMASDDFLQNALLPSFPKVKDDNSDGHQSDQFENGQASNH